MEGVGGPGVEGRRPVDLSRYDNVGYSHGRGLFVRALWFLASALVVRNPLNPFSGIKVAALQLFGARVGRCVVIKPRVDVSHPWNVEIGDNSWVGEGAVLHALGRIRIGNNACVSQEACLETGNHDWKDEAFGLVVREIVVEDGAWVGARAMVLPGVTVGTHSVVTAGSIASRSTPPWSICRGNPAAPVGERKIK